ncbi:MAG: MmgE/PrpD family protein [Firmicutes bacterium]|nr:MmgE/PrpD family protein [Bacillota bacterium]
MSRLEDFVAFIEESTWSAAPAPVRERLTLSVANWLAATMGGALDPEAGPLIQGALALGSGHLCLVGVGRRAGAMAAVWGNASLAHLQDFDDTHLATVVHPSAPVIPAALAAAEASRARPASFLEACLVGEEVAIRLGLALDLTGTDRGWHYTAVVGPVAAAAAAGKVMGLDRERLAHAVGLAAAAPTGLRASFGSHAKAYQVGRAGALGWAAASAAGQGVTADLSCLRALGRAVSAGLDEEVLTAALGERWHVADNTFKPYACGIVLHPLIEAAAGIREEGVRPEEVTRITARVHPLVLDFTAIAAPTRGLEGKFSAAHALAVGLVDGTAGPEQFSDARVTDPLIRALWARAEIVGDETMGRDAAEVEVEAGARRVIRRVSHARGSLERPMTREDLRHKFEQLVLPTIPRAHADRLWELTFALEGEEDLAPWLEATWDWRPRA